MAQELGEAKGKITVDTSQPQQAVGQMQGVGQKIEQSLGRVDTALKRNEDSMRKMGRALNTVGALFGINMGVGAVRQLGMFVTENAKLATQYRRQEVAARSLAGSQAALNELMVAYNTVTKGAVDEATALADVTRLQAVGFADSTAALTEFLTAARGISVAVGRPQDYVIAQLGLAINNQSLMRLDQLGLGIGEVKDRVAELRKEDKELSKEMAFQQAIIGIANEKFGALNDSIEGQRTGIEALTKAWKDFRLEQGQQDEGLIQMMAGAAARGLEGGAERSLLSPAAQIRQGDPLSDFLNRMGAPLPGMTNFAGPVVSLTGANALPAPPSRPGIATQGRTDEQTAVIVAHFQNLKSIERQANADRISEVRSFEQQRAQVVQRFGQQMVREAEDFARQRDRSIADFRDNIADMRRDAARRESDMREEFERGIGDLRETHEERISEITRDYHRDREQAEASHKEKLLGAAARLDAAGVVAEQRRFAKETKQKETRFNRAIGKENKKLKDAEDDREESLEKQLEMARRNDERRIQDMEEDFRQRQQREDEDRALRLRRMEEDNALQLEELQKAHDDKVAQIAQNAIDERTQAESDFKQDLIDQGIFHDDWITAQELFQEKSLEKFEEWFESMGRVMLGQTSSEGGVSGGTTGALDTGGGNVFEQFAGGGPVNRTGPALVHAGEFVLNPQTTGALRGMLGSFGQSDLVRAAGSRNINVAEGAIQIQASEGMNVAVLGQVVRAELIAALQVAS